MGGSLGPVRKSGRSPRLLPEQGAHGSWLLQLHSGETLMCVTPPGGLSTAVGVLSSRCERVGSSPHWLLLASSLGAQTLPGFPEGSAQVAAWCRALTRRQLSKGLFTLLVYSVNGAST